MSQVEIECPNCGEDYEPDHQATIVVIFNDKTYNHIRTRCPDCEHALLLFFDSPHWLTLGYSVIHIHDVPDDVRKVYEEASYEDDPDQNTTEFEPIRTEELSPRHEQLIRDLGKSLADTPDDLLMDMFSSPPPKSNLPLLWN